MSHTRAPKVQDGSPANTTKGRRNRRLGRMIAAGISVVVIATTAVASAANLTAVPVKADPGINEATPAADGPWLLWHQNERSAPGKDNVYAQRGARRPIKVNARGTHAGAGGIDGRKVVYSQWNRKTAGNVFIFDLVSKRRTKLPTKVNGRYDEFHPTVSGRWVLFTRWNWRRDKSLVLLYNTRTRTVRVLA